MLNLNLPFQKSKLLDTKIGSNHFFKVGLVRKWPRSSALAAASGTGGGSIFVPVLISFSYLQAEWCALGEGNVEKWNLCVFFKDEWSIW